MKRPLRPAWPVIALVMLLALLLALLLGGWGVMSVAPQSSLGRAVSGLLKEIFGPGGDGRSDELSQERNSGGTGGGGGKGQGTGGDGPNEGGPDPRLADPAALPKGITGIDGEGGTGFDRAVRKNGVWYPVYSPGPRPGPGAPPLTEVPLTIASATPPPGRVGQAFRYQAEAVGGAAPYVWSMTLGPEAAAFVMDSNAGTLTGLSATPLKTTLNLTVTDAVGTKKSAAMPLIIRPEKDLNLITSELPRVGLMENFGFALTAEGGVPSYRWKVSGTLPSGISLNPETGRLAGLTEAAGEFPLIFAVTDAQDVTAEKSLTLRAGTGLEITTPPALPAVSPGEDYTLEFQAEGGAGPYTWEMTGGRFPDASWKLSSDGMLEGRAPGAEGMAEFTLTVTDADGETFEKTFRLAVSDILIAIPSREKVGLAWSPTAVAGIMAGSGSPQGFLVERDGEVVYRGNRNNFVDHGPSAGSTPEYSLLAVMPDGSEQSLGSRKVSVLPMSLERGLPGERGDPYADAVISFQPLTPGGYGASQIPRNIAGPPDGRSTYAPAYRASEVASLHARVGAGGSVELEFTDNIVELTEGEDLTVFENVMFVGGDANQRFMEPATISVALFPGEWHRLPTDVLPAGEGKPVDVYNPFYYARGIAGRNPTTGDDPTDPSRSGGDSFDLNAAAGTAGLSWIRFIRIQSTGDQAMSDDAGGDIIRHNDDPNFGPLTGGGSSGFDLDAVSAVHY
ncbi:MAG: putative Ig domain-containing protein [Verrucomicrobiota bacterium]